MLRLACSFDLRLLVDKGLPRLQQWKDREVESDWRDLITASIEEHFVAVKHPEELWFVNTRFSCLCHARARVSFVPRWRPPFVTELEPSDRCHLNGLGMVRRPAALRHGAGRDRRLRPAGGRTRPGAAS